MANLTTQTVVGSGLAPAFAAAAAGGDKVAPGDDTFLVVKNADASAKTVTVDSARPCDQGVDHDLVVVVPAGGERWIGPLVANRFAGADGLVSVSYSAVTSVTVGAVKVATR